MSQVNSAVRTAVRPGDLKRTEMAFDLEQVRPFFEPKSVAVLGASNDGTKFGGRLMTNLLKDGYKGTIYPVNRSEAEVQGVKAFPTLADLPGTPELVLVSIPAAGVPGAIAECVAVKSKAAVVYGAGFAEAGPEGAKLQELVAKHLKGSGMRMVGPNCLGVRNMHFPVNAANGRPFRRCPVRSQ
jgi:acyl-CoA synthetase (NDP forming)